MAYFVTIRDNGWAVIKSGAQRAIKVFDTQKEAIEFAKSLAKKENTTYSIQNKDGKFRKG